MRSANKNNLQDFFSKVRTIGNKRKWGDNSEKQIPARETCLKKTPCKRWNLKCVTSNVTISLGHACWLHITYNISRGVFFPTTCFCSNGWINCVSRTTSLFTICPRKNSCRQAGFWKKFMHLQISFLLVCNISILGRHLFGSRDFAIYMQEIFWTINSKGNKAAYLSIGT